jgi:hypothetical protein
MRRVGAGLVRAAGVEVAEAEVVRAAGVGVMRAVGAVGTLVAFGLALALALALGGCRAAGPEMPTDFAGELSGEGFTRAESYEQIYGRIASGIPAPALARPDVEADAGTDAGTGTDESVEADAGADAGTGAGESAGADAGADESAEADESAGADAGADAGAGADESAGADAGADTEADAGKVAGLSASSLEVSGGRGYAYSAKGEYLQVLDELTGARAQEINLYDCAALGGQALCVLYGKDTLAVLYVSNEGVYRQSGDYALAAWAAPRSMVLLFDATEPARIVFERAIGIVGTPVAVLAEGDMLVVAARHKVVPDVEGGGAWMLDGRGVEDVRGYVDALALRANDAVAYVPSFYDDGELAPLLPEQIYLSGWGDATVATVVASFTLSGRSAASLFALYDPGPPHVSTGAQAGPAAGAGAAAAAGAGAGAEAAVGAAAGAGAGVQVVPDGFVFDYVVDVQGTPAIASISVPIGPAGTLEGIGQVSWSDKGA